MIGRLIAAVALCLVAATPASAFLVRGGGNAPPPSYTPLCGGSLPACAYAYSTERQMVSTATTAIQVMRSVDGTTQNIGFTAGGLVNTTAVDQFCNASVAGVISRNCFISEIIDQTGNGCLVFNSTSSHLPNYMIDPGHQGLPRFQKTWQGSAALTFLLDSAGGSTGTPAHLCATLTGPAQSFFFAGNSAYAAFSSGQFGLMETVPAGGPQGAMFAAFIGPSGFAYDHCLTSSPCGGVDSEAQGPQYNYTRTANDDFIDVAAAPTSGNSPWDVWINNVNVSLPFAPDSVADALVTGKRMTWGNSGDHSTPGPSIGRSEAFYSLVLSDAQMQALYNNEVTFTGSLTTTYAGPGDNSVVGNETSYSTGLSNNKVLQLQWLSFCISLRKCYAGYEGPALNVCQGSGSCEDIGWVNNAIDATTMSAFCGPVSGLNNCAVQIWYNQALAQSGTTQGVGTGIDATAVSSSNRPLVLWSGCGTSTITVCIQTNPTNYFTTSGITVFGGYAMSAVAMRTGSTSTLSAIMDAATFPPFIGFASSANTCTGGASTGAMSSVACNDNVVHSITVDAHTSPSASTTTWADGSSGAASTAAISYNSTGLGVGANASGFNPCTCQISELLVYADASNTSFNTALGTAKVAAVRANQQSAFGF